MKNLTCFKGQIILCIESCLNEVSPLLFAFSLQSENILIDANFKASKHAHISEAIAKGFLLNGERGVIQEVKKDLTEGYIGFALISDLEIDHNLEIVGFKLLYKRLNSVVLT